MSGDARVMIVVSVPFEAPRVTLGATRVEVVVAGVGGGSLRLDEGSGPVVVTGSCGLLVRGGRRGDLVIPSAVASSLGGPALEPDAPLRAALLAAASRARLPVRQGALVQARDVVDAPAERERLAADHAAAAVDLESHRIARAASGAGRPWVVIRWVSDTPERPLRPLRDVLGAVEGGQPTGAALLRRLLRRPGLVPAFVSLGAASLLGRARVGRVLRGALGGAGELRVESW